MAENAVEIRRSERGGITFLLANLPANIAPGKLSLQIIIRPKLQKPRIKLCLDRRIREGGQKLRPLNGGR